MPYPHRDCSEYQHEEWGQPHEVFSPSMAIAGCPRCMSDWLRQLDRLDPNESPPMPDQLEAMNTAVNHTLDEYWQGRRADVMRGLSKYVVQLP